MNRKKNNLLIFVAFIIIIITIPIILNFILNITITEFEIIGDEKNWLSFWSSYLGSIIIGIITLYVLYKTLNQNQNNHYKLIKFQIDTITHKTEQEWLNSLKINLIKNLSILSYDNIESLVSLIKVQSSNLDLIREISMNQQEMKSLKSEFKILYHNNFETSQQINYKKELHNLVNQNLEILEKFKDYLVSWERNIENFERFNELKDTFSNFNIKKLEMMREEGYKMGRQMKEKVENILKDHKDSITIINNEIEKKSIELIVSEEQSLEKKLKNMLN